MILYFTSKLTGSSWTAGVKRHQLLFGLEDLISLLWKRSMGATDMFYRLFWCFSRGSSTSASQSTGSQHQSLVVATPSGPTSCWLGFLPGSLQRGNTTRFGNDTAEIPREPDTNLQLSNHISIILLAQFGFDTAENGPVKFANFFFFFFALIGRTILIKDSKRSGRLSATTRKALSRTCEMLFN